MVVDASAILAILFDEPERKAIGLAILAAEQPVISAVNRWEALVGAQSRLGDAGRARVETVMVELRLATAALDGELADRAADAAKRYGGRPARLNLGDCFAYALAKQRNEPLLFKGDDFTHTDVVAAPY